MKTKLSLILLAVFLLAACGPKAAPTPAGPLPPVIVNTTVAPTNTTVAPINTTVAPLSGNVDVAISGFAFSPAALTVKVGTTVKWTNQDSVGHTVVADDNSWGSGNLNQGDSFSFAFNTAGTYAYHCGVHPNMKATITVVP
jgi:plastocyanin